VIGYELVLEDIEIRFLELIRVLGAHNNEAKCSECTLQKQSAILLHGVGEALHELLKQQIEEVGIGAQLVYFLLILTFEVVAIPLLI
jgi:hypothetical protein